jgi:signal transduction histidine kinase
MMNNQVNFLLVDDLVENLMALEGLLKRDGLSLLKAKSGAEALELLLVHDVALAIIDVNMPEMDGFELVTLMRGTEKTRQVPVIFVTAAAADTQRPFRGYEAGAVDFLFKPIDPDMLRSKANVFFELYRQKQEIARQRDELRSVAEENLGLLGESRVQAEALRQREMELRKARDELEVRVQERTGELEQAYKKLVVETRQKQKLEEQLRQAQKMEAIGTLAGGIAHDFNNMLAVVIGNSELMLDDLEEESPCRHNAMQILKASKRGRDLVKQILMFSRKSDHKRKAIDIVPLMKESFLLLRPSIPASVEMTFEPATKEAVVFADPSEIHQILVNLAVNAEYAMRERGGALTVRVDQKTFLSGDRIPASNLAPGEYIVLTVRDTGVGMRPEIRKRLFDPFFTTKEVGQGTGMGCALVYGIVRDLNGAITVHSRPGKGATFRIFLPNANAPNAAQDEQSTGTMEGGTERILIVDDEPDLAEINRLALERLGYEVTATTDSREALDLFREEPARYDLVITDQAMPQITGIHLAENILKIRRDIPIILCTGYSHTVSQDKANSAGISEFLMKPVAKGELAHAVRRALDGERG